MGLFFTAIISSAQSSDISVLSNKRTIGKMMTTQEELKAKEYIFPERVYNSYIDTISKTITIQLRGLSKNEKWMNNTGKMVLYDLTDEKVKWSKKIAYQVCSIQQFGSTIIYTAGGKSYCLNIENGENLWEVKNDIYTIDPVAHIGIGYKLKTAKGYSNTLEGIDLKNGNVIWQKELNREYGWNDAFRLQNSKWMIVAAGLHTFDIHDGLGWDYNTVTGEKDYSETVAANAAGAAIGLLTGTFVMSTGHNLVRDIASNIYSDSTEFYFASKEKISRINRNDGKVIWSYVLPVGLSSKSSLFAKDNLLFMINNGYAFMGNRQLDFGTPFFAAFNKENGEQIFFHTINTQKNPILDFKIENDNVLLVFKDRIVKYSLLDGSQILEKSINNKEFGELKYFVGDRIYVETANSSLTNLSISDTSKNYILTSNGKILTLDFELNIDDNIDLDRLYVGYLRIKDYKFVAKNNQTLVLDADNNKIAEMDITPQSVLIGNKIYSIREKSFFEIDLTNLIGQLQ